MDLTVDAKPEVTRIDTLPQYHFNWHNADTSTHIWGTIGTKEIVFMCYYRYLETINILEKNMVFRY
jgi:hypothetical protein